LPQVKAADLKFPNEDGEISVTDDDDDDDDEPDNEDYTGDMPTNLESTLNQEDTATVVLGLTGMSYAMATQEQEILIEEENDG
jgi:hypothetical protein